MVDRSLKRCVGRITIFGGNVAIKCNKHSDCSLAVKEWQLPSLQELRQWYDKPPWPPTTATTAAKRALAKDHLNELRVLRDSATWPGTRTRQDLINEASELDGEPE